MINTNEPGFDRITSESLYRKCLNAVGEREQSHSDSVCRKRVKTTIDSAVYLLSLVQNMENMEESFRCGEHVNLWSSGLTLKVI